MKKDEKEKRRKNIEGNIWKVYLYNACLGMFFIIPVMVLFWGEHGLNMTQIMLLQSIYALFVVVLEIPTGYLSDLYSRKINLAISSLFWFVGIVLLTFSSSFAEFMIAEITVAVASALSSGTLSAFIYDSLVELKREDEFKKVQGKLLFFGFMAIAVSSIVGSVVAEFYGFEYALYLSIPFFGASFIIALLFTEPERYKMVISENYVRELMQVIKVNLVTNKRLRWIMIYSGVVLGFNHACMWLYQPYFELSGLDMIYFGFVFAAFQVVAAVSSKYAYRVEEFFGEKRSLIGLIFLVAVSYFLMSHFVFLFSFSFAFIQQFVRGFRMVVVTDYINKIVSSANRATILSVENFMGRMCYALIIPVVGYTVDVFSLILALQLLAITTFVAGVIMVVLLRRNKVI